MHFRCYPLVIVNTNPYCFHIQIMYLNYSTTGRICPHFSSQFCHHFKLSHQCDKVKGIDNIKYKMQHNKEWKRKSIFLLLLNSLSIFNSPYSFKMYLSILTRTFLKICIIHQSVIIHFPTVIYFQLTAWFSHAREEGHKSVLSQ